MKKHGPPPCGMNRVGSRLMAFTEDYSDGLEPSRVTGERQLNATLGVDANVGPRLQILR
jgi:hypothetical protein